MQLNIRRSLRKVNHVFRRFLSIVKNVEGKKINARPFEEIPGPKGLPLIGTMHKYLPIIGRNQ